MSGEQDEFLDPRDAEHNAAYAALDTWLEGVSLGDAKLLALSDVQAESSINAELGRQDDLVEDEKVTLYARRALIQETQRTRQDTVSGYATAFIELKNIIQNDINPHARKVMDYYEAQGKPAMTVPTQLSHELGRRRIRIISNPQAG